MSQSSNYNSDDIALKIIDAKIEALDRVESKYQSNNWMAGVIFGMILCAEVLSTSYTVYKIGHGKELDKWLKGLTMSAFPVALTIAGCYFVADRYGIKQQQEKSIERYQAMLALNQQK